MATALFALSGTVTLENPRAVSASRRVPCASLGRCFEPRNYNVTFLVSSWPREPRLETVML